MNILGNSTSERKVIALRIDGILVDQDVSIDPDQCGLIERTASAARILLHAFGGYTFDPVPQFDDHRILISVSPSNQEGVPFDPDAFDSFCRNFAELIDSGRAGRKPHWDCTNNCLDVEAIARRFKDVGEVCFEVSGGRAIRFARITTRKNDEKPLATFDVESAAEISDVKHSEGRCLVDRDRVENLQPGDRMSLDEMGEIERVNRTIGSLVRILNDSGTEDLFQSSQDDGQDEDNAD